MNNIYLELKKTRDLTQKINNILMPTIGDNVINNILKKSHKIHNFPKQTK